MYNLRTNYYPRITQPHSRFDTNQKLVIAYQPEVEPTNDNASCFMCDQRRRQRLKLYHMIASVKEIKMHQPGIEPRANAWKAFMLPLHHWCCCSLVMF